MAKGLSTGQILLIINGAAELLALGLEAYQAAGATPEEVQAARAASDARITASITAVEQSAPPEPGSGA